MSSARDTCKTCGDTDKILDKGMCTRCQPIYEHPTPRDKLEKQSGWFRARLRASNARVDELEEELAALRGSFDLTISSRNKTKDAARAEVFRISETLERLRGLLL